MIQDYTTSKPTWLLPLNQGFISQLVVIVTKKWWGIAVRIEDDILITPNGPVNLSKHQENGRK
jgi:Xaa-Pro aminopeptidase